MNKIFAIFGAMIVIALAAFFILCNKPKPENRSDSDFGKTKGEITGSANNKNDKKESMENIKEFALTGIPEMAAGLRFNDDGTFEFFYIYGASDRKASGKYVEENDRIILHGSKKPGQDMIVMKQKKTGSGYTVRIKDQTPQLVTGIVCTFIKGNDSVTAETNSDGVAFVDSKSFDKIQLIHPFFPDHPTEIDLSGNSYNDFELFLNKSLEEVVFDNTILQKSKEEGDETLSFENIYLFPSHSKFVRKK